MRFTSFAELLPLSGSFMQVLKISKLALLVYLILPAALDPGVYSATNRNEYQRQK
jgi:hypothetical protein